MNEKYLAKCIKTVVNSPVSVQVWGAISSRGLSLQRKVNSNMDRAKYESDIIYDIEMKCECAVFPQKGNIFIHDLVPCHNSKSTRTFLESKGISILEWPGNPLYMNPIENIWNIMKRLVTKCCVRKDMWKQVCESLVKCSNERPGRTFSIKCQGELQIL